MPAMMFGIRCFGLRPVSRRILIGLIWSDRFVRALKSSWQTKLGPSGMNALSAFSGLRSGMTCRGFADRNQIDIQKADLCVFINSR